MRNSHVPNVFFGASVHYDTLNNECIPEDDHARADGSPESGQRRSWVPIEHWLQPGCLQPSSQARPARLQPMLYGDPTAPLSALRGPICARMVVLRDTKEI